MENLKVQGTKAFIWDFLGKMAGQGMSFVVSIFLARLLAPAEFGLFAMVMVVIGIAQVFTDVGLGSALIQRRHVRPVHYASVFYFNLLIGSILTFITFVSASKIAEFYHNSALVSLTQVVAFSFLINALGAVQSTKLRKELKYDILTKVSFTASLFSGIIGVALAFYGAGVWSLVAQILLSEILFTILVWKASHWVPSLMFSFRALRQLWVFGFRMFLAGALNAFFERVEFIIIGKLFPPAILGFYQRAKALNTLVIQYSSGSLMSVLFPLLSKVQKDLPRFQRIVIRGLGLISFVVFLLLGVLYLVADDIIVLLFGVKWIPSVEYFQVLVLSGFGYPVSALLVNVLSSRGNSKIFLRLEIYKKVLLTVQMVILFYFGILAFLYSRIIFSPMAIYLNIIFVSREIHTPKLQLIRPIVVQASLATVATLIVVYLNSGVHFNHLLTFLIKGFEYLAIYMILNIIFKTESYTYFINEVKPIYQKFRKTAHA